jgi:predicted small lipoprotein YifL
MRADPNPVRTVRSPAAVARGLLLAVALLLLAAACGRDGAWELPDPGDVAPRYGTDARAELRGNLLEVQVPMEEAVVRRGGTIWARGGPYFYLFSPPTRDLLVEYPDLVAVRVVTTTIEGTEIARAMLRRDAFTEGRWQEALGRSALAQRDGTARPRAIEEMVVWGERYTEFDYNPEFVGR